MRDRPRTDNSSAIREKEEAPRNLRYETCGKSQSREKGKTGSSLNAQKREELVHQESSYLFGEDKMVSLKL